MRRLLLAAASGLLLLGACAAPDESSAPQPGSPTQSPASLPEIIPSEPTGPLLEGPPLSDSDEDGTFRLTIRSDQDRYRAGQPIEVKATLTYLGPAGEVVALGSGGGLVGFGLESREPTLRIGAAFTGDCARHPMVRDEPMSYTFQKSGGFSPDDLLADFYEAYFASPELRLPEGTWTIGAGGDFSTGADCGDRLHSLSASVEVIVEP